MDPRLNQALQLHRAGRPQEAEPLYRALLTADSDNVQARQLLALLAVQSGRAGEAAELLAEGARRHPMLVEMWINLGGALGVLQRFDEADRCYRRALALDPGHVAAAVNYGNTLMRRRRPAASVRAYRRALALDPGHAAARSRLDAAVAEWGEKLARAERLAAAGLPLPPPGAGSGAAAEALAAGRVWIDVGEREKAESAWRAAVAADPACAPAQALLGELLALRSGLSEIAAGRPFVADRKAGEEAAAALAAAYAADPSDAESARQRFAIVETMAKIGLASNDLLAQTARGAWDWLHRSPKDVEAAAVVGFHAYRRGRLAAAAALNRRFLRRFTADEIMRHHELGVWAMLRADAGFLDGLGSGDAAAARLTPLEALGDPAAQDGGAPAVMLSCDDRYFRRFAPAMLESLARRMPGAAVVFHVVNPSMESMEDLARWRRDRRLAFGCSVERTDFTGWPDSKRLSYYAAGRFMRAHQWRRRLGRPLIVLDVDASVNADLRSLAAEMAGYDVGLLIDPRGRGPSRDITVCFNYYNDTPAGAEYLSRTAAYIGWFLAQPDAYWLLDQTAHYAVCWRMERLGALRVRRYDFLNFPHCSFIGAK